MSVSKSILFLLPAMLLSTSILASIPLQPQGGGDSAVQQGFNGPFQGINSVAMALNAANDTPVVLTGNISAAIGDEKYQFVDQTGSIVLEIEHDKWFGLSITPNSRITIYGEVDKDFAQTAMVDVEKVQLAN